MKIYQKPDTTTMLLLTDRLCETEVTSVGGNGGLSTGGEGDPNYNPM